MVELTRHPIDTTACLARVTTAACGAEVLFVGTTRQWTGQGADRVETAYLVYDGYEQMAISQMQQLEADARERWPLQDVVLVHRLGRVDIGQASVVVAVGAAHRAAAFEAARWLIDMIKQHVPIWKCEHGESSGPKWVHPV